ncbi:SDR family NAD(P)-dependent oxidoreductase [Nocardia huaxiensis]|uniref:SDR family NAD(P)-dependent oxidoreductase n=1 Tax=Nocardia huaxiensis TaxID=2755382 RepID=A0A7D6V728_9NOCA|nr:SDR family NAD(P)-dependent oxidoreductase [Nocardia huaxiensis]QLY29212.1 SDR family NAD(P)-dependent oxidoreductase [Nocardia huaxiensis]UFS97287.1 SDR family NAD(P)-dependent oxidoreductase [Nocardia huaxiensis]
MRTVLVTGAAAGIGRETARLFARKGDRVVLADIDLAGAEAAAAEITADGGTAYAHPLDVADEKQWDELGRWVRAEVGPVHVLVNNAGVMDTGGFVETTAAQWQKLVDIDLMSVIYGSRLFARQMIDNGIRGHIVNVSSGAAYLPLKLIPAYGVVKSAVLMASQALRVELRQYGIGVTAICPGAIRTDLLEHGERAGLTGARQEAWRADVAMAQSLAYAGPDKVARAIERSVRRNWAVVPVNPESWFAYGAFRLSPSAFRTVVNIASFERADYLLERVRPLLARLAK